MHRILMKTALLLVALAGVAGLGSAPLAQLFEVVNVTPTPNQPGVGWGITLSIQFTHPVNPSTIDNTSIQLVGAFTGRVPLNFSLSSDESRVTAYLSPSDPVRFSADESVEVRITRAVESAAGDTLETPWNYHLRTYTVHGTGYFEDHLTLVPGYGAVSVEAGDLNGDGLFDLATPHINGRLTIFLNTSPPEGRPLSFTEHTFWIGSSLSTVLLKDLDNDGLKDVIVADQDADLLRIGINLGDGTDYSWSTLPTCNHPQRLRSGDFDGDGNTDLVFPCQYDENLYVLLGDGLGGFEDPVVFPVLGGWAIDMEARDLDLDGDLDLVITNELSEELIVMRNGGPGLPLAERFSVTSTMPLTAALGIAVEDYDGDGRPDVAAGTLNNASVAVCRMLPGCRLADPVLYMTGWSHSHKLRAVVSLDYDGDGDHDLAVVNSDFSRWRLMNNDGSGVFSARSDDEAPERPILPLAGDFDGDGTVDIAIPGRVSGELRIFLGRQDPADIAENEPWSQEEPAAFTAGPNPFQDRVIFRLAGGASGRLEVYSPTGRLQTSFQVESRGGHPQQIVWDGRDQAGRDTPAGVYQVRLVTAEQVSVSNVIRMK